MDDRDDIYKISYVILGGQHPGAIVNSNQKPVIGNVVDLGDEKFEVIEVVDLMPSRGRFHYLHVTCKSLK